MSRRYLLIADPVKCTGCKICQLVCSYSKEKVFNPAKARLRVDRIESPALDVIMACHQCTKPPCAEVCPVNAINRNGRGVMTVNTDKCIGCGLCVENCPLGAINLHPDNNVPMFCDQCGQCVKYCPVKTLRLVEINVLANEKREASIKRLYAWRGESTTAWEVSG